MSILSRQIVLFCTLVALVMVGIGLGTAGAPHSSTARPEQFSQTITTPTIPAESADPTLYDNFDNLAYDGSVNPALWSIGSQGECQIEQGDGVMIFRSGTTNYSYCLLSPEPQTLARLEDVGAFEARVSIDGDSTTGFVTQVLQILTEDIEPGHWSATCGLVAESGVPTLRFDATHSSDDPAVNPNMNDLTVELPAEFDRWYTIRIEVDPVTLAFACYADGTLMGSVIPSEIDILQDALFFRHIKIDRDRNAAPAVSYLDDVRIIPPADPTLYDNFDDPAYDGGYNRALWAGQTTPDGCQMAQQGGLLVFPNTSSTEGLGCNLSLTQPAQLETVGGFEARMQMASDHSGEYAGLQLEINASLPGGTAELPRIHWQLQCALEAGLREELEAVFKLNRYYTDYATAFELIDSEIDVHIPAEYDRWYTFRLEIDPTTSTASCYVDGELLGSAIPNDAETLNTASFVRLIAISLNPNTTASGYVDDVRVIPPPSAESTDQ